MKKKLLGNSKFQITQIGFGAWAIGGPWEWGWGDQNDSDSINTIRESLESGINWIDTAPVYGLGYSEKIVAKALKEVRDKPYVFTKCGLVWGSDNKIYGSLKRDIAILFIQANRNH